jgi:hypothetical protein
MSSEDGPHPRGARMRAGQDLPTTPQCSVDRVKQSRKPLGPRFANAPKLRQKCWREVNGWLRKWGAARARLRCHFRVGYAGCPSCSTGRGRARRCTIDTDQAAMLELSVAADRLDSQWAPRHLPFVTNCRSMGCAAKKLSNSRKHAGCYQVASGVLHHML